MRRTGTKLRRDRRGVDRRGWEGEEKTDRGEERREEGRGREEIEKRSGRGD